MLQSQSRYTIDLTIIVVMTKLMLIKFEDYGYKSDKNRVGLSTGLKKA
jgi:hypothetical protein